METTTAAAVPNTTIHDLMTPAFLVSRHVTQRNTEAMARVAKDRGVALRPHMKTHKTLEVARLQTAGQEHPKIIVSTLAEARFFASEFDDITYAVPISPSKLDEVVSLSRKVKTFNLLVDTLKTVEALIDYHDNHKEEPIPTFSVFVKVDTGYHRHGVDPQSEEAIAIVQALTNPSNATKVCFAGLYSHSGHSYGGACREEIERIVQEECDVISGFAELLSSKYSIDSPVVSIGSTPSCTHLPPKEKMGKVNEIHPGNNVFFDRTQADLGSCQLTDVSVAVLSRVISHYPSRNMFAIDAGALALSKDDGASHLYKEGCGYGLIRKNGKNFPELRIKKISQEVGLVEILPPSEEGSSNADYFETFAIGSLLLILPNHSCLTAALYDRYHVLDALDDEQVVDRWTPCSGW
ncbi:D-threo-3-hydroxyaspartate dehydratase-like [Balamuthia mandrillaris]